MCNCNSSFCAVCCRRVKAYRFDNVPEITGDLQLYTEFYKVGEAYGHWKFTIDDLEAYLDIPTVLWQDKLVAFGHTATGGLFYDSAFIWNYTDSALTIGTRDIGAEGLYSFTIGNTNTAEGQYSLIVGASNVTNTAHSAVFGKANSILGSYNSIFGEANNINGNGNNVFGAGNIVGDNSNIFGASLDTNGFYGNAMFSDQTGGSLAIANDAFTAQFAGGYRFRLDASSTAVNISSTGIVTIDNVVNNNAEDQLLVWNSTTKEVEYRDVSSLPGGGGGSGTVTSVDAAFLNGTALTVVGGAITTAGTFDFEWQGLNTDYVAGDGSIIAFPTLTSGTVTSVSAGNGMTFTTITTSGAVTLGTPSSITLASTNSVGVGTHSHLFAPGGTTAQYIRGDGTLATTPLGSVTSVGMTITAATALSVAGSPITTSGTFAVTWTGSNTQYVAGDGSLITFPTLTSGTVTAVNSGAGMDFTNFTTSGTIILGTPSTITLASVNGASGTTHSHALNLGGTSGQYLAGDNTLQTFPTIPTVTPSALTRTNDTNILLNLTGSNTTALLQAVDIEVAWSGLLSYTRGGTGLGSLGTANQILRVNAGATSLEYFTPTWTSNTGTVTNFSANDLTTFTDPLFTVNVTNSTTTPDLTFTLPTLTQKLVFAAPWGVTGKPFWRQLLPSDLQADGASTGQVIAWNGTAWVPSAAGGGYWSRSGTVLYTTTSADAVVINTATSNSALARLNVGELGYTAANYQSNIGLHQTDTYGIDKGVSISGYPQAGGPYLGVGKIGFYKENATLNNQDTYFSISTRTGASNVTVDSTKFKISGAGLVTITNIPSSSSSVNLVVSNSGTLESRTIASLAYYTPGTGISIAGPVITNTLPSKWQIIGALYLTPAVSAYDIATPITGSIGYVTMTKGTASQCGYFEVRTAAAARVGYIGYQTGYMNYSSDIGNHRFNGGTVQINNIPSGSTSLNLLTTNGGVVETRTIASLTGLTTDVFKIQGGTTNASAITDDIYHNGKLKLGTSTSSAYQLSVSGTGYFTSTVDFNNNVGIQGFTTGAVIKNLVKLNSSNQEEIGVSGTDIILPAYTSARSADTKVSTDKYMYVNASGLVKLDSDENIRNVIGWISKPTNTGVTAGGGPTKISGSTVQQTAGGPYTTVSGNLTIPAKDRYHLITVTVQFVTTSGVAATPNITFDVYNGSGVVQDSAYIVNHDVINDTKEYSFVLQGTTAGVTSIYVRATATVAGITVQKCHMKAMDMGPV